MLKGRLSWKTALGGLAAVVAFLSSVAAIIEFGSATLKSSKSIPEENEELSSLQSESSLIGLPVNDHYARLFVNGPSSNPTHRYIVVFRNGEYGSPRISELFLTPSGKYQEKKIRDLDYGFRPIRLEGDSRFIALSKVVRSTVGPHILYDMDIALFSSANLTTRLDKYQLRNCYPLWDGTEPVLLSDAPNGYALRLKTTCKSAELIGDETSSVSLMSNGEDRTDRSVILRIYNDCGESCLISCYLADTDRYDRVLELYGTFGAPPRCPDSIFEAT